MFKSGKCGREQKKIKECSIIIVKLYTFHTPPLSQFQQFPFFRQQLNITEN
jgi:hypothetical protein